jgi:alpha-L-rhamnosidase
MAHPDRRAFLLQAVLEMGAVPLLSAAPWSAETEQDRLLRRTWTAKWISAPGAPPNDYGAYHFRRTIDLATRPEHYVVHVSADNRYQLFVNGQRAAWGPARGDLYHWRYETVDVAPYLVAGRNVFAALVWNFGELAPEAQITCQTGFLLQGDTEAERAADTGTNWKAQRSTAYSPIEFSSAQMHGYFVAGPGDRVDGAAHPWGWKAADFDDSRWRAAAVVSIAAGREASDPHTRWMLVPRTIPAMEERLERLQKVRRASGVPQPQVFPAQPEPVHVPAGTHAVLLLDQTYLTTAFPELTVSGGKDAVVRLRYAEALFQPAAPGSRNMEKGNRDEVEGKVFIGSHDEFVSDGGARRTFRPLWWRTYRYLELDIETRQEPLTVDDLRATYVGFPFQRRARFDAGAPDLNRILDVGWRTARLCAHETYMDCPYYEQLQYVGDTRVQCLVSLFNTGDGRLMRNAIDLINDSRQSDGCTMSRYPTRLEQYIPGFSLWWIGMVHDYWWYVDDPESVRRMLPGVRAVLSFFEGYQQADGSLRQLPWWRYFDWVPGWPNGNAPQEPDGPSALFDLLLLMAYGWAAEMEAGLGVRALSEMDRGRERQLRETVQRLYWDADKRMYADTPRKQQFSQHTNTLAVLGDVIAGEPARDLILRILTAPGLAQTGLFFRYYVHCALAKAGEGERYLDQLGDWRDMLSRGLTTFSEIVDRPGSPSRSDCHAWSASPNIEIFRTVLGVDSMAPGFHRVAVRPHLGKLIGVAGGVPHPKGEVEVRMEPRGAGFEVTVSLPEGVTGEFAWRGTRRELSAGVNRFAVAG